MTCFKALHEGPDVAVRKYEKSANDGHWSGGADQKGGQGENKGICAHCGGPEAPDDPLQECAVDGATYRLHRGCQRDWLDGKTADRGVVVGPARGATCLVCNVADDAVMKIRPAVPGSKTEALHEECAPHWFKRAS